MGKNGMRRDVYYHPDPTFDAVVGSCRKEARKAGREERTMAEKMSEAGVVSDECARMLMAAKVRTAAVQHILPQAADRAQQAKTVYELDSLMDVLTEQEETLDNAARLIRRARCRIVAAKIDLLPRPKEAADE